MHFNDTLLLRFCLLLSLLGLLGLQQVSAQTASLTLNVDAIHKDNLEPNISNSSINFDGRVSGNLNVRIFTHSKWAFRFGAGVNDMRYTVSGRSLQSDYEAKRRDLSGIFGIEKHFKLLFLDIYPGFYIPVTVVGDDIIQTNFEEIKNGNVKAGLSLVLGGSIRLLKFLRLGAEFNYNFDTFKAEVWDNGDNTEKFDAKNLNYNTAITLGIQF